MKPRVVALERQITDFRRATAASFNAMREDMTDLRQDTADLREHVDNGFIEMRAKFDAAAAGHQQIVGLLERLIEDQD